MRIRIIFDKGLVSSKFLKSWFIVDQDSIPTSEVLSNIKALFCVQESCHAELEGFLIPDNQLFDKIVKEGEIVNIKQGIFTIPSKPKFEFCSSRARNVKKIVKKEQDESSESESIQKPVKIQKRPYLDSESSESLKKPLIKPQAKKIPIKSLPMKQPEPEFLEKVFKSFKIQDFDPCKYDEIFPGDEILFKTLELRDDNTPGISEFKVFTNQNGKIIEKNEESVTLSLLGEQSKQEFLKLNRVELIEEGEFESFEVTVPKTELKELMKRTKPIP